MVCFAKVGVALSVAKHNAVPDLFFFLHEFCVILPRKSCENEYSHQHLEAVPPRYYVVVPLPPCLFSLPTLLCTLYTAYMTAATHIHASTLCRDSNWVTVAITNMA